MSAAPSTATWLRGSSAEAAPGTVAAAAAAVVMVMLVVEVVRAAPIGKRWSGDGSREPSSLLGGGGGVRYEG